MRKIKPFIVGFAGCLLALVTVNSVSAQATDGSAKVVAKSGDARYFVAGDPTPHQIKVGMVVKPGMTIQTATGRDNYVDLILNSAHAQEAPIATPSEIAHYTPKAEQDGIRIYENTVLEVDKLSVTQTGADTVTDTELDLKAGKILGTVKKLSPTSKYEVKIPNGVAGIRGTIYVLSANGILSVLTSSDQIKDVNDAYRLGANSFLVKPYDFEDLVHFTRLMQEFWLQRSKCPDAFRAPKTLPKPDEPVAPPEQSAKADA